MNLLPAIKAIRQEINDVERDYRSKIYPLEQCLNSLTKLNTVCEVCEGKGKVLRMRACAEDDAPDPDDPRDWITCHTCHGTGKVNTKEE